MHIFGIIIKYYMYAYNILPLIILIHTYTKTLLIHTCTHTLSHTHRVTHTCTYTHTRLHTNTLSHTLLPSYSHTHMQAKAAEEAGDYTAAAENRRLARQWNIKGIIVGVVVWLIVLFFLIIAIGLGIYNGILRQKIDALLSSYSY